MLMRYFFVASVFFISASVQSAPELTTLTDARLCTEIGIAAAQNNTALLSRLEEEGTRRDKMQITRINTSECDRLAVAAVNQKMHTMLSKADEKLNESYEKMETSRKQAQRNAETSR